jgi:hypothetical protein
MGTERGRPRPQQRTNDQLPVLGGDPQNHIAAPGDGRAPKKNKRPDLRPAFVVTRFKRLHPGAQKCDATNLGALSEPHREQNLYANPKRTAKF